MLQAGFAKADITPDFPVPLAGYFTRKPGFPDRCAIRFSYAPWPFGTEKPP